MKTPNLEENAQNKNQEISEFSLDINQTFSGSLLSNRRPSSRLIASPSKMAYSRSNKIAEATLAKVRSLINKNLLEDAITQINAFFTAKSNQKISMSPSNIISPQNQDLQTTLNLNFSHLTCLIALKKYQQCLQVIEKIIQLNSEFKKETIKFLKAICYENKKDYQIALISIQQALYAFQQKLPNQKNIDHFFLKAKILKNLNQLNQASNILQSILSKFPQHHQSIKALIDVHVINQNLTKALQIIDSTLKEFQNQPKFQQQLLTKKVQIQYKIHHYSEAFTSINQLEQKFNLRQSKLNYLKGKISLKLTNYQNAIIYFNQALTIQSSPFYVRLSLAELIIYFLRQRDFYEASLYCKRSTHLLLQNNEIIQNLSFLAEGLILLMKRNFEEGLKTVLKINLNVLKGIKETSDLKFLKNLFLNAQGFALFSLGRHRQALQCYLKMQVTEGEEEYLPCFYNIRLVQGILSILDEQNEEKAIQFFEKAIDFLLRPQPYFYISVILTQKNMKYQSSADIFMKILSILESGLNVNQTAEMHFYRSLVFMYLGMNVEAIEDLDKAIQVSEDNVIQHFFAKGLIYFLQQNYQQAIAEFEVTLSIEEKYARAMLQKAKCQIIQGNPEQAYTDLQAYREMDSTGIDTAVWELYFLLQERKFEQILQIDLNNYNQNSSSQVTDAIDEIKNTCNFFLGRFEDSGASGKLIMALIYQTFEELLKLLDEALQIKVNVGPISEIDLKFIKGYVLFRMESFTDAISVFQEIESILSINEREMSNQDLELRFLITKINIILCTYASKNIETCRQKVILLINQINEGEVSQELRVVLSKIQAQIQAPLQDSIEPKDEDLYTIELLLDKQLLSSFLPLQRIRNLSLKLIIPFPILQVEQLKPNRQKMLQDYEFKRIQNRPEAPWIKRGQFGVLFTNQIREYNNLHLNTEETQSNSKQKLIDDLKLGSEVLLKLQKISQNP